MEASERLSGGVFGRAALARALAGPWGVAALVYALLLWAGNRLLADPDTYWHIAAGRWIWAHRTVPATDPFSATLHGAPWHAHEWLAEAILAGAYDGFGWAGVVALAAFSAALALALLTTALRRVLPVQWALAAVGLAFFLMAAHLTARPHILALPILVAWSAVLVEARAAGRAPAARLVPLMVLWANLHGGFVVGLALAAFFALEALVEAPDTAARRRAFLGWGGFGLAAALASLITPYGFEGWRFPFALMALGPALDFVTEWHSPDFSLLQPLELWLLALVVLLLAQGVRVRWPRLLLLAALVHLALAHARNAELLALLAPLILADAFAERAGGPVVAPLHSGGLAARLGLGALMAVATCVAALAGYTHEDGKIAPRAALDAARRAQVAGPVFNDYDFGGYLIFTGVAPFVDGRVDLYGDAYMAAYRAALDDRGDALPLLLERYRIGWTLLQPGSPATAALDRDAGWTRVYADGAAVVHRRR